jgi:hypothetical protein
MSYTNENENAGHGGETSHVEPDDIGVGMMVVLFGLCAVSLALIVVLLQAWFYNWKDAVAADRPQPESEPAAIAAMQVARIDRYGWVDAKKQIRAIPITRAMDLIVEEYGEAKDSSKKASN